MKLIQSFLNIVAITILIIGVYWTWLTVFSGCEADENTVDVDHTHEPQHGPIDSVAGRNIP